MKRRKTNFIIKVLAGAAALLVGVLAEVELRVFDDARESAMDLTLSVSSAEAVLLRPATPLSVAGVSRRTARRTSRRIRYYAALPASCVWSAPYHYCGGIYYQPVDQGGTIVYVIVNP